MREFQRIQWKCDLSIYLSFYPSTNIQKKEADQDLRQWEEREIDKSKIFVGDQKKSRKLNKWRKESHLKSTGVEGNDTIKETKGTKKLSKKERTRNLTLGWGGGNLSTSSVIRSLCCLKKNLDFPFSWQTQNTKCIGLNRDITERTEFLYILIHQILIDSISLLFWGITNWFQMHCK